MQFPQRNNKTRPPKQTRDLKKQKQKIYINKLSIMLLKHESIKKFNSNFQWLKFEITLVKDLI